MTTKYTAADRRADQLAVNASLAPLNDAYFAACGISRVEGMALLRAGLPPPTPTFSTAHPPPRPGQRAGDSEADEACRVMTIGSPLV